jgi:hypothetical protein
MLPLHLTLPSHLLLWSHAAQQQQPQHRHQTAQALC